MGKRDFLKIKADRPEEKVERPLAVQEFERSLLFQDTHFPSVGGSRASVASSRRSSRAASVTSARYAPSIATSLRKSQQYAGQQPMEVVKNQVMIKYLYQQQANNGWRSDATTRSEGVILRLSRDEYLCQPASLVYSPLLAALKSLNVQAAMTVHSAAIAAYLEGMPHSVDIPLMNGLSVQLLPTIEDLAKARVYQFAACIASKSMLVVWDDDAMNMLARAKSIEFELMQLLWSTDLDDASRTAKLDKTNDSVVNEKEITAAEEIYLEENGEAKPRPTMFICAILVSFSLLALMAILGLGFRQIIIQIVIERGYATNIYNRVALVALTPIWAFFGMFFFNVLVNNVAQLIGPIQQVSMNSKTYSAIRTKRLTRDLPHVTVQMPVYKEGLAGVIAPTIQSIKAAISTYELQGGSANIFVNDDGFQLFNDEQRQERVDFYLRNGIGWIARPPHSKDGFQRAGKFKKASNMNFALNISCSMEDKLKRLERHADWTATDEGEATEWALEQTLNEVEKAKSITAYAAGNVRVGDYILIIDSDTRVPKDCLLDAVSELEKSPEVAILQFSSGVMQVSHNYFENGITFFTNLIYTAIKYGVANGDVAPFVGHNAMLRWSAIQDVAFETDGDLKFWSESHVSEDFDMALRLQIKGYITRLAAWAGDGFKEGVSLTVYDELARWQKYAYGCNELVFHPIRFWIIRGPFTKLFRTFLFSNMPLASKVNIIAYVGTYYAIAAAWILTLANYFIIGWFKGYIDKYYVSSWNVWIVLILTFSGLGNVSLAVLRYRSGERSFIGSLFENFKWLFLLFIFLGGISIHVSEAILAHMFEINMTWGATAKELEFSNFFLEVPKVLRQFWFSMIFCIVTIAGMVILGKASEFSFIPHGWEITQIESIVPLSSLVVSHFLLPLALNPALMTFAF